MLQLSKFPFSKVVKCDCMSAAFVCRPCISGVPRISNQQLVNLKAFGLQKLDSRLHRSGSSVSSAPSSIAEVEALPWEGLDLDQLYEQAEGSVRIRQHVNPLKKELQVPAEPLDWTTAYKNAELPLALDIGCGSGRFLLALAKKLPGHNFLGLDIRNKLMERANQWAQISEVGDRVRFQLANATVSLDHMLSSYPGGVELVTIQFPDPHFKNSHKKRRIVQQQLIEAVAKLIRPGGRVLLQSDVELVTAAMRDEFELYGKGAFELSPDHNITDQAIPGKGLQWRGSNWLPSNPLGVPTEREVHTLRHGGNVYRTLLVRKPDIVL